ncbi:nucleoid-associated protein [Wohlfahrtiimonas chitiniclastica]|uniref:nucleoid-associated protein n=1 Tax=Wohlfahrtiimonas chitiniclastica TaxID=400946 RepID=UPI001BCCB1D3|nr:nucleoid-associated protein [Wohlfahrtiimonas chitiniclastica]MBS7814979.1 nucleoid-associated protein [Wohlfahrtiimonas chitiniclastica]
MSQIQVKNVVIHQFIKTGDKNSGYHTDCKLRDQENLITDVVKDLIQKLHENYESKENSVQRGVFKDDNILGIGKFAKYFLSKERDISIFNELIKDCEQYYPTNHIPTKDNNFYNLSICFMQELNKTGSSGSINGGLLFFTDYIIGHRNFFMIIMFEKEEGFDINDLDVKKVESIDIKKLKQALRINCSILGDNLINTETKELTHKKNYISFISTGKDDVREFFTNAAVILPFLGLQNLNKSLHVYVLKNAFFE